MSLLLDKQQPQVLRHIKKALTQHFSPNSSLYAQMLADKVVSDISKKGGAVVFVILHAAADIGLEEEGFVFGEIVTPFPFTPLPVSN